MKHEEIIEGLKYTVAMCEYDPLTGDIIERCFMNDMTRTTYDACKAAIEFIEKHQYVHDKCKKCIEFSEFNKQPNSLEQIKWERDIAIEQLKQLGYSLGEKIKTDEDCISREYLIDKIGTVDGLEGVENSNLFAKYYMDIVKSAPSVTPQQQSVTDFADKCKECGKILNDKLQTRWIPVSERLPEVCEFVNCTCHSLIDDREDWVIETVYIPQPSDSPYSDWGNIPMLNVGDCKVVAWMHRDIPEPYNAESEDKE